MNRFAVREGLIGLVVAMAMLGSWACSASPESPQPPEDARRVYTAGQYFDGSKFIPCYWTGTTRTNLAGDGTHDAGANAVFVDGGTVYTAGYYIDGAGFRPCYWRGTVRTDLPGGGDKAFAYSIFVSGGTVYTAGCFFDGVKDVPCYWTHEADASALFVSAGTVFTAGYYSNGLRNIPCYWRGTTRTDLPGDGTHNAYAYGIFVD